MRKFATYQPSGPGSQSPDDLVLGMAEQRHVTGIAGLYSAREGVTTQAGESWAQGVMNRVGVSACVVVAESDGRVVAYARAARLNRETTPDGFYLLGVVVDPSFRRMGIGHALTWKRMDWIGQHADHAFYFANAANKATIDLHHRFGFREVQRASEIAGRTFEGGAETGILY